MKRNTISIAPALCLILLLGYFAAPVLGEETTDKIFRVKLKQDELASGMIIEAETRASQKELLKKRLAMGVPLNGLLNQTIIYGADQARVNYLDIPSGEWFEFGYTKLIKTDGSMAPVVTKEEVIIQVATSSQNLEDIILRLLKPDLLQTYRIKTHRLPQGWTLIVERFLQSEEIRKCESMSGAQIRQALVQEFFVNRVEVAVKYYHADTPESAERLARQLAKKSTPLIKRTVQLAGVVIVTVESQNSDLNETATALVNWW